MFTANGNEIKKLRQLNTQNSHNLHGLINFTDKALEALQPFTDTEVNAVTQKHSDWHYSYYQNGVKDFTEKQQTALVSYFYHYLPPIWKLMQQNEFCFYLHSKENFKKDNLHPAIIKNTIPSFSFAVKEEYNFIKVSSTVHIENEEVLLQAGMVHGILLKIDNIFYVIPQKDFYTMQLFIDGFVAAPLNQKTAFLQNLLVPLSQKHTVHNSSLIEEVEETITPEGQVETILWCKMEKEQEKIYNSFKEHYRLLLMGKIEEQGLAKSSFYVLEGLTKLRQICDSPAILNEDEKFPDVSAKANLLMQEIEENTGRNKTLVFSQFTTMLRLIDKKLQQHNIPTLYLDGSTPAKKRKELVDIFQNDADSPRVFLISLKAGGVGLNLTAADYVYLIDPWWNPAVEQQAIDRTHRIGQTNKVFAYKMICKDSIEEKILLLQQKKKSLAANLIGEETGFIKKLNKEDIAYLFE